MVDNTLYQIHLQKIFTSETLATRLSTFYSLLSPEEHLVQRAVRLTCWDTPLPEAEDRRQNNCRDCVLCFNASGIVGLNLEYNGWCFHHFPPKSTTEKLRPTNYEGENNHANQQPTICTPRY